MSEVKKGKLETGVERFDPHVEERMARVYDMRTRGLTYDVIADTLGISTATVGKDIREMGRRYRERLEEVDPVLLLAENLQWLEELERVCMFEASSAGKVSKRIIDEETGQTIEFEISDPNKAKFMDTALKARRDKIKLLLDTGVIPKDPEKMNQNLKSIKKVEERIESRKKRTQEEIEASLENLLTYGNRM